MTWVNILCVAVGGFAGGCTRSAVSSWLNRSEARIPYGTLAVNLAGSFILGIMLALTGLGMLGAPWKALIVTGFCGGLTTFSTFTSEVYALFDGKHPTRAWVYWLGSIALGVALVAAGFAVTRGLA